MKICILLVTALTCVAGCTVQPELTPAEQQRFAERWKLDVVLPEVTPFDADPEQRAIYLNYYWFGYQDGIVGMTSTFCPNGHPWYEIQSRGHYDGTTAGLEARQPQITVDEQAKNTPD